MERFLRACRSHYYHAYRVVDDVDDRIASYYESGAYASAANKRVATNEGRKKTRKVGKADETKEYADADGGRSASSVTIRGDRASSVSSVSRRQRRRQR